jgi:hypothetical protein
MRSSASRAKIHSVFAAAMADRDVGDHEHVGARLAGEPCGVVRRSAVGDDHLGRPRDVPYALRDLRPLVERGDDDGDGRRHAFLES